MEFIDKTETRKRVKEILEWIYRVLTHSNLYLIKKINAYEIDDDTDLTSLATLNRKNKSTAKKIEIDSYIYEFLDYSSMRLSATGKQYIYLHFMRGISNSDLKIGYYDDEFNCTYTFTGAYQIEKNIIDEFMYVFSKGIVCYVENNKGEY